MFNIAEKSFEGESQWKTLSLTHVAYPRGDLYGKFLALFSMLPFAVMVAFATLSLFIRDVHVISFGVGQVLNEILNNLLKRHFCDPRPQQGEGENNDNEYSYGWPSSHCQFQAFFFTYSSLCIIFRLKQSHPLLPRWLLLASNILALVLITHSRLYLRYHYLYQCLHGILIGSSMAIAWFLFVIYIGEPLFWSHLLKTSINSDYLWLISKYFTLNDETYYLGPLASSIRKDQ